MSATRWQVSRGSRSARGLRSFLWVVVVLLGSLGLLVAAGEAGASPSVGDGVVPAERIVASARACARRELEAGLREGGAGARWELAFPVLDLPARSGAAVLTPALVTVATAPVRTVFCTVEVRVAGRLVRKVGVKWRLVGGAGGGAGASGTSSSVRGPLSRPAGMATPAAVLVRKGSTVTVRATVHGVEVETRGEALGNGALGETVPVRNLATRAVITTRVTAAGEVQAEGR